MKKISLLLFAFFLVLVPVSAKSNTKQEKEAAFNAGKSVGLNTKDSEDFPSCPTVPDKFKKYADSYKEGWSEGFAKSAAWRAYRAGYSWGYARPYTYGTSSFEENFPLLYKRGRKRGPYNVGFSLGYWSYVVNIDDLLSTPDHYDREHEAKLKEIIFCYKEHNKGSNLALSSLKSGFKDGQIASQSDAYKYEKFAPHRKFRDDMKSYYKSGILSGRVAAKERGDLDSIFKYYKPLSFEPLPPEDENTRKYFWGAYRAGFWWSIFEAYYGDVYNEVYR
ncbi:MAG: hypothetical protein K6B43_05825 [Treponema sp.]|nr:hypothetical protein [Treponema sp.]